MEVEVKAPELSESVQSGTLLAWRRKEGDTVQRDETLVDLETDKVILEVSAPASGVLMAIRRPDGAEVKAGELLAIIETSEETLVPPAGATPAKLPATLAGAPPQVAAAAAVTDTSAMAPVPPSMASAGEGDHAPMQGMQPCPPCPPCESAEDRPEHRVPMTRLRQRIAERMLEAQHTAAILTTFNEINMQPVQDLRARYQAQFQAEHGIKLGFMSFFVKAACQALKAYPVVNARVEGRDIVYHDFLDIGVAVSSERGLVVPVLRHADRLGFAEIELRIADFAKRANALQLTLEELEGGTFTISNGGVFGSLLSTPILNPPQSGVLGLHKIQDRPIAESGQVVIRPMMYVALSYDHRIIDGREAVSFLRTLKEALEDPARLLLEV